MFIPFLYHFGAHRSLHCSLKALSSASLISRYILRLGPRGRCCLCAASPNDKMYLDIREADEWLFIIKSDMTYVKCIHEKSILNNSTAHCASNVRYDTILLFLLQKWQKEPRNCKYVIRFIFGIIDKKLSSCWERITSIPFPTCYT